MDRPMDEMSADVLREVLIDGLRVRHADGVLTPRPWTAAQARWVAELDLRLPDGPVLELCTGVGHIGLLAVRGTGRRGILVDADPLACRLAAHNAADAGLAGLVAVHCERIDGGPLVCLSGTRAPIVIADPPYVPSSEVRRFPDDPVRAIDGGPDGLDVVRTVLSTAACSLEPSGALLVQLRGASQALAVTAALDSDWSGLGLVAEDLRTFGEDRAVLRLSCRTTSPGADASSVVERIGRHADG